MEPIEFLIMQVFGTACYFFGFFIGRKSNKKENV